MTNHGWSDELLTGDAHVDLQHRTLFQMVEELGDAIAEGRDEAVLTDTLFAVLLYAGEHFRDEEALMERIVQRKIGHEQTITLNYLTRLAVAKI